MQNRALGKRHVGCLLACLAGAAVAQPPATPSFPRADAAAAAQRLAADLDRTLAPLTPLYAALGGVQGEATIESVLADTFRALDAYGAAEAHLKRAQDAAQRAELDVQTADILIARGEVALLTGDYAHAESVSRDLFEIAQRAQLSDAEAFAEEYIGVLDRRRGKLDEAARHETRALELRRLLHDDAGVATALSNLGTIARDRGDYAQALDLHLKSDAIRERSGVRLELSLRNLALIYRDLGDDVATRTYFTRALDVARRHADTSNYAATLGTYASYLADVREFEPALAAADEALALGQATGNRPSIAFSLLDSGRALLGLNRVADAETRLQQALAMGRELGQHEIMARSLVALAEASLARGDRAVARKLLDETFASPQARDSKPLLAQAYALRERLASAEGDKSAALDDAHRLAALREELLGTRASRRLSALESQYARAASEQKLALVTKDNALQAALLRQERLQRIYGIAALVGLSLILALSVWRFFGVRKLNRALATRNAEIESKRVALSEANTRLEQQAQQLYQAAITDPLTGVFNRGHLMRQLDSLITSCQRDQRELAVLLIDFDHFKQINDARGHLFGDRVLVGGVQTLRQWLEPGDLLGRYGGEEFVAAVTGRDANEVIALAERLRQRVAETLATFAPELTPMATISIGIALLSRLPKTARLESLIEAADKAVYASKASGRNRVTSYAAA